MGLRKELSDAVYDTWVKVESRTEQKQDWRLPFVAIENSKATHDPEVLAACRKLARVDEYSLSLSLSLPVHEYKNLSLPYVEEYKGQFSSNGFFNEERQKSYSTKQAMEAVRRVACFSLLRNDMGELEKTSRSIA